jgi:hypothetical protein
MVVMANCQRASASASINYSPLYKFCRSFQTPAATGGSIAAAAFAS